MVDYVDCVYAQLDTLHGTAGARNFVLLNVAPLNHAPQFALPGDGGVIGSEYWVNEANYSTNVYVRPDDTALGSKLTRGLLPRLQHACEREDATNGGAGEHDLLVPDAI